jgi:hypothetical protein
MVLIVAKSRRDRSADARAAQQNFKDCVGSSGTEPQIEIRSTMLRVIFLSRRSYSLVVRGSAWPARRWTSSKGQALLEQIGDGGDAEGVGREPGGQTGVPQPPLDHLADVAGVHTAVGQLSGLADGAAE